ncbi:MAG: diguanylate cyclase [Lachnospiraceae bacterium]|nr:diguanylate cyclase [Lachnospiraceae bacterium]
MEHWIAVVDDEAICLTNARNMLGEEGMRVSCLRSGSDLLKFIARNSPDLILLDIMMPGMDGFETFNALRKLEDELGRPHVPVIFLTGDNDAAVEQQGLELGASDFIRKPFNKEIIVKRIGNTIANNKTIESLTEEAMVDKLTGFLNKAHGAERISKLCGRKTGALMILDLDNFKLVNDLFGHEMGDRVLVAFADIIRNNTRETDTISRIGGDEFMAFYEDLTDESAVTSITLRLNAQLQEEADALMGEGHGIPLGISVGVVMVPRHGRDYDKLFALADSALYRVKQNGKHGCFVHDPLADSDDLAGADPETRLDRIIKIVEERNDTGGALILGSDAFALIYRFILRFYKRYGGTAALVLFTVSCSVQEDNRELLEICAAFSDMLQKTLRMSDIMMQSGSYSFFVMLTERTKLEAEDAISRIMREWEKTEHAASAEAEYVYRYFEHS